jgi:hypothetical protein
MYAFPALMHHSGHSPASSNIQGPLVRVGPSSHTYIPWALMPLGPHLILGVREYHVKLVANSDGGIDMTLVATRRAHTFPLVLVVCSRENLAMCSHLSSTRRGTGIFLRVSFVLIFI